MKKTVFFLILLLGMFITQNNISFADDHLQVASFINENTPIYSEPSENSNLITEQHKYKQYPVLFKTKTSNINKTYTVHPGDTLGNLANKFRVQVRDIQKTNDLLGYHLYVGQVLQIPTNVFKYNIKPNDELWKIARRFHVANEDLIRLNSVDALLLKPGDQLKIPLAFYQIQMLGEQKGWVSNQDATVHTESRIRLGWQYNGDEASYQEELQIDSLDIVSPKWFTLKSTSPFVNLSSIAGTSAKAEKEGKEVWPLFGNRFDPELTNEILTDPMKKNRVIQSLTKSLVERKCKGINVDFENINPKNKNDYVVFISQLKKALKPYNIKVSVDVSRENADPFWSGSLDRRGLGKAADYIIMMGYDEHWATSPIAGSVASIPWTREGIALLLKDVPAHKVILGVPFYTREWITDSKGNVTSIDRTIREMEQLIQQKNLHPTFDKKTLQNYVTYHANGKKHEIWIEDEQSLRLRYDLVEHFHLKGAAAWYISGAPVEVWKTLQ